MISLKEEITIPSPLAAVWPLLRDPALVAACIPGATMSDDAGDGTYRGNIRVKFGPTVAVFKGEAVLSYDDAGHRCTIEGRGIDGRGASRALASGTVVASGTETTLLVIEGGFNVTGPLETFANAGGVHVARALLAEFSNNMARLVAEREAVPAPAAAEAAAAMPAADAGAEPASAAPPAAPPPPPPAPAPAAEISGFAILWQAFKSWLRQVFQTKGNGSR